VRIEKESQIESMDPDAAEEEKLLDQQQEMEFKLEQDIMIERDEKIGRISHAIQTVNSIFRDLGELVTSQGQTLDLIDDKIGSAEDRTE
jgi:syntaxin 7